MKRGFLRRTFEYRWKKRKKNGVCIDSLYIDALEQLRERMRFISVVSNSFGDAVYEIFQKASDVLNLTLRL